MLVGLVDIHVAEVRGAGYIGGPAVHVAGVFNLVLARGRIRHATLFAAGVTDAGGTGAAHVVQTGQRHLHAHLGIKLATRAREADGTHLRRAYDQPPLE